MSEKTNAKTKVMAALLEYIQGKSMSGQWIPLKVEDAKEISKNNNASIVCNALNKLTNAPEIECKMIRPEGSRRSIRHYRYTSLSSPLPSGENLKPVVVIEPTTVNLEPISPDITQVIFNKLEAIQADITRHDKSRLVQVINLLRLFKAETEPISDYAEKITELLPVRVVDVQRYVESLCKGGFAKITNGKLTLRLQNNDDNPPQDIANNKEEELFLNNSSDDSAVESSNSKEQEPQGQDSQEGIPETDSADEKEVMSLLVSNLEEFAQYQKGFNDLLSGAIGYLKSSNPVIVNDLQEINGTLNDKVAYLTDELKKGNSAAQELIAENKSLRLENNTLRDEAKSAKKQLCFRKQGEEKFHSHMQERFQVVIAEITNAVVDYNRQPDWKHTASAKAQFQNNIVGAITSAIDDILKYSSDKPDRDLI